MPSLIKKISILLILMLMFGCTSVKYNGAKPIVKHVDYPQIGKTITAYVGDHLVQKGTVSKESVLIVHSTIDGALYDIPAKNYRQIGSDAKNDFFSAVGVIRNPFADPIQALSLGKNSFAKLCVVTTFGTTSCYEGHYERKQMLSEKGNSFQQTLIYSGRVGDKINISYREFSNNMARPAFNNDVEYDLAASNTIGYKSALIEILKADNSSITYKLLRNFP